MASMNYDSDQFLKNFYIPDHILVPDSKGDHITGVPACPVLVFINSKSGGQLGGDLLITYRALLNGNQVFDLGEETPDNVLHRLYIRLEMLKLNGDKLALKIQERLRLIVAGGDGTAGWLLGVVCDLKLSHPPPIATVPLGTGNNLPFAFGWGKKNPGTDRDSVLSFLSRVLKAKEMKIDSWHILLRMRAPKEGSCEPIAPLELPHSLHAFHRVASSDELNMEGCHTFRGGFWNYFSMGGKQTTNPWVFEPEYPGKSRIFDGRTGDPFEQPVIIGKPYILKLIHQVDDKIHGRSSGHYAVVTQQPLRGRAKQGGQRIGEIEVWALEGFGVAHILQEMLTYKSDHIRARQEVLGTTIIGGTIPNPQDAPESFYT